MKSSFRARAELALTTGCVALLLAVTGCGSAEPAGLVSGKVTYQGAPVAEGTVIFSSYSLGASADTQIGEGGSYKIETHTGGLPPGEYKVTILPPEIPDPASLGGNTEPGTITKQVGDIPKLYRSLATTPLTVTVKDGENTIDLAME